MPESGTVKRRIFARAMALWAVFLLLPGAGLSAGAGNGRPDGLSITLPVKNPEMPGAWFLHDLHTRALRDRDCTVCHQEKDGRLVFRFKGAENVPPDQGMAFYHDRCAGCHQDLADKGEKAGPRTADCRACHTDSPLPVSRAAFGMDRSLHFRHASSAQIRGTSPAEIGETNCSACHHVQDPATKKLGYTEKARESCRYCHAAEPGPDVRSFSQAAHAGCVNCHLAQKAAGKKSGPWECAGCHDPVSQAAFPAIPGVPRLMAGQPDAKVVSGWIEAMNADVKARPGMTLVAFDHKTHDTEVLSCRACHHASLAPCGKCHTVAGAKEGDFIRLDQAMHARASRPACVGCHREAALSPACAGCHAQMPEKAMDKEDCSRCHTLAPDGLRAVGLDAETLAATAAASVAGMPQSMVLPDVASIPDTVDIKALSDEYEPAKFPHRKIVLALYEKAKPSGLAAVFHKEPLTFCAGCHHHSEPSLTPPQCGSCHGKPFSRLTPGRPGLKGAYHVQCITCHQEMGIEKPAATACVECHAKKARAVAR